MQESSMLHLVVLTGAGMSAESGLSTFRDSDGLWAGYSPQEVASVEGWASNPQRVLDFYAERRREFEGAQPNEGHRLLASLEDRYRVTIITQNVDDLHERAGSREVIHLHGELMKNRSVRDPYTTYPVTPDTSALHVGDMAPDGSQLRPFIVWFGEEVPNMIPAIEATEGADLFVVIGTSLEVYPAAALLGYTRRDCPVFLIDPKPVHSTYRPDLIQIQKGASEGVRELCHRLCQAEE
ncbi:transcriptional regulator, Sir2 family [Porphyromonas catoniae ATCC 51270]|uniref:NAD-dependent protein deacylase n=2 Tax=Porphyromonas catoniae TaxID=41976 RepID=Z4WY53_9PORP|nr:transcriptional regulator, Sir2 family [Porphyromonas catoniae ATCC 51270]